MAGLFYLTNQPPQMTTIFGLNVILFLFYVFGYNLRHSEIWLNYPAWLSNILISPAQHQVHHSSDPKHFDTNMGLIFAFWDRLFGTLYIPKGYEKLSYGISRKQPNPFNTVAEIYYKPFVWAAATLREMIAAPVRRALVYGGFGALAAGYLSLQAMMAANAPAKFSGPMLEDMTWLEVHEAVAGKGFNRVIIPTGGTEQNGPFVALGKHNFIIRHTARQMATRLGHTLVAPVMAYVPEGSIEPKSGHMAYPGTLSLPEPVFESVLEATVRSLKAHGFKHVFIIGDSGDSVGAQARIAERLDAEFAADGVRVAHISDYYSANGQIAALEAKGYSRKDIGTHAGIRDTSELMHVSPKHVRFKHYKLPDGMKAGANGRPDEASAKTGRELLTLKVDAGVKQINALLAGWGEEVQDRKQLVREKNFIDRLTTAATE
jgi:creatinine amidohydrolase/Fe(II)-dependent formamide hydrolase-like protein